MKKLFYLTIIVLVAFSCQKLPSAEELAKSEAANSAQSLETIYGEIGFKERTAMKDNETLIDNFFGIAAVANPITNPGQVPGPNPPGAGNLLKSMGIGWVRVEVPWDEIESTPGIYDWTVVDRIVDVNNTKGLNTLLLLRNTPNWAAVNYNYDFKSYGDKGDAYDDNRNEIWKVEPVKKENGNIIPCNGSGIPVGYNFTKRPGEKIFYVTDTLAQPFKDLRVKNVNKWTDFVKAVVNRYKSTTNFFQICNEHTPSTNQFPRDGVQEVAERWYIPAYDAAKSISSTIRIMNCWPSLVKKKEQDVFDAAILSKLDIYAHHYGDVARWTNDITDNKIVHVFDRYKTNPNLPFWATEYGTVYNKRVSGTDGANDYFKISHSYPQIIAQCLRHTWNDKNKFKLFWWPYFKEIENENDSTKALIAKYGSTIFLTSHGKQLKTVYALLKGSNGTMLKLLNNQTEFTYSASNTSGMFPKDKDSTEGFELDDSFVFAIGLKQNWAVNGFLNSKITITLSDAVRAKITGTTPEIKIVDELGRIRMITSFIIGTKSFVVPNGDPAVTGNGTTGTGIQIEPKDVEVLFVQVFKTNPTSSTSKQ